MTVTAAFDVGPLAGRLTGIGHAVAALQQALDARADIALAPYRISFRARPETGVRRLPLPAGAAHRSWQRLSVPRVDRWLGPADLIHGTNYVVPPSRLPRLVSVYDCWFLLHPERAHPDVVRAGRVLRRAIADGAVVHTSSHATAIVMRELFPSAAVHTVHLGALPLATEATAMPAPIAELDGTPFVVSVATLERRKNLPRLVQAFAMVAAAHPTLRLVLAGGESDDSAAVHAAIDALPHAVSDRVLLTGYVDDHVRSWLMHHATVVAYPSLDEGFGFPLLDAMQAGTAIVASTAGSIPEIAGDAARLVPPHDVEALAHALSEVVGDADMRTGLIAAGTRRWQEFTWQATADGIAALYHQLVGGR